MVLQTTKHVLTPFTLGSKLAEIESKDPTKYQHPLMTEHVAFLNNEVRPNAPKLERSMEAYPGLGRPPLAAEPGSAPPYPVVGPSQPQCGSRAVDYQSDKFVGLSREMATYNYNRTTSIMCAHHREGPLPAVSHASFSPSLVCAGRAHALDAESMVSVIDIVAVWMVLRSQQCRCGCAWYMACSTNIVANAVW